MSDAAAANGPNYVKRRQRVFLVLSGIFLGTLALLNVLGISRFIDMSFEVFGMNIPLVVAVGVLPYPVTTTKLLVLLSEVPQVPPQAATLGAPKAAPAFINAPTAAATPPRSVTASGRWPRNTTPCWVRLSSTEWPPWRA